MDKLQSIRFFMKLSETLSFKETALHFQVPPSSVSRAIKSLEAEMGVVLFERTTRQVRLTEAGGWYGAEVAEPLRALAAAETMVEAQSREPMGTIRITALPGYGDILLFSALERFRTRYPRVICDVQFTDRYLDLSTGEIDVALRATSMPPEYLIARRLHSNRFVMVAAPDYLDRRGRPAHLADILQYDALAYRGPNGITPWQVRLTSGSVVPVPKKPILVSNHGLQLLRAARQGEGLALLPIWGVTDDLANGTLEEVTVAEGPFSITPGAEMSIFLLYDPMKARLGKVRALVDFLVDELGEK